MPQSCCVVGCKSVAGKTKVKFYSFPSNKDRQDKWVDALHKGNFVPSYHRVCSLHFTLDSFEKTSKLKSTAVPNININLGRKIRKRLHFEECDHNYFKCETLNENSENLLRDDLCSLMEEPLDLSTSKINLDQSEQIATNKLDFSHRTPRGKKRSKNFTVETPIKSRLRKRIKIIQQKVRRRNNNIINLKKLNIMLRKFAQGEIKKQILPGSDTKSTIPKPEFNSYLPQTGPDYFDYDGRNYVNIRLNEYNEEDAENEPSKTALFSSNMSSVESLTYASSIIDLKDLDVDEIKLFEHYKFKDPADISNNLQIAQSKEKIIQAIHSNCIVLITGVTGCGKSTQVPQFILDDCMSKKKYCNIIVTQPRRIAAISVSKQVNKERGWKNGLLVGYQVGRNRDFNPKTTKILYCTTGILLQKIIKAKSLCEFTHIILDEVHERTLEMDFLLLVIKKLIRINSQSVRVILMSATANSYKLQEYFNDYYGLPYNRHEGAQLIGVDGKFNFPIIKHYLDNLYGVIPSARRMEFDKPQIDEAGYETAIQLVIAFNSMETTGVIKKNSSVLIFLPGIFEIEQMHRLMENEMITGNHKWTLLPLHSSITSDEQVRVFDKPPPGYRKIILSTNIAESSITVSDISYVIDFCLMKQLKNEMNSNYSMLVMTWASKSNCEQRAGRVGRVSEGRVYRLVPEIMFNKQFSDHETPEMNRCSLSRIVLMAKMLDMGTPEQLLGSALDPPSLKNIVLTILTLKQLGALLPTVNGVISSADGDITFLGKVMAQLPLDPAMSKLIYFGHIFNILNEAIIMACGLSIKSIFSQPFNKRLDAYTQKLSWANNSCSDPIAYINPYQSWLEKKPEFDRNQHLEKSWANANYIQLSAIRELYDLVSDVTDRLKRSFGILINSGAMKWTKPEEKAMACKVILAGAFYPNYFIRGASNAYMDEHHVLKLLEEHDPNQTVYFTGFPSDQPKNLYKEAIENMFPEKFVGKPKAFFSTSNKIYIEFPSKINNIDPSNCQKKIDQLIPGNICFGVYVAMKMYQLKYEFKIPLLKPEDADKKMKLSKQMAAQKIVHHNNVLPVKKSILEEIETNIKDITITVTYFESVNCFWAQLFDEVNKNKLLKVWDIINGMENLTIAKSNDLKIGNVYIVTYKEEKYRATFISILHGTRKKYKFFLIDFGQAVELFVENVFNITNLNEDIKNKVYNVPALAFKCTISKIQPMLHGNLESCWSEEANYLIKYNGSFPKMLHGTIYSIVNGVLSFEDLKYIENNNTISIPEYLIENKLANRSNESFASKMDHDKRSKNYKISSNEIWQKSNDFGLNFKSPSKEEAYIMHSLKGPFSPLEMSVHGLNHNCAAKIVKIESQSVNSVLLDSNPNDYHERLFVAGNVCMNESDKLILWDTTMMPNIPGMPAIVGLLFSPCVEMRYNSSFTKIIGAICGLGYNPKTSRPLFTENDIEITFDTVVDNDFLTKVNVIRMLLNKCVNPEDEEGPGDIFEIAYHLQNTLMELFSAPTKFKSPEPFLRKYMWGCVSKLRLCSPYSDNTPMVNPMAGSDVYKLIWTVKLSLKISQTECKDLLIKLTKIKRLKDGFIYNNFYSGIPSEDLYCPLCHLSFSNNTSLEMHFNNYQHIERYQLARTELHVSYQGLFSDIQRL